MSAHNVMQEIAAARAAGTLLTTAAATLTLKQLIDNHCIRGGNWALAMPIAGLDSLKGRSWIFYCAASSLTITLMGTTHDKTTTLLVNDAAMIYCDGAHFFQVNSTTSA